MKKIISFVMMVVLLGLGAQAQHMSFKGIPMQGSVQSFATKLAAKGYKQVSKENDIVALEGDFAGVKKCTIVLVGNDKGNIFKVAVAFPSWDKWGDAESDYYRLKELMIEKYGAPYVEVEEFDMDYDWYKKHKVIEQEVVFGSGWVVEGGKISLSIEPWDSSSIMAELIYYDKAGQQEAIQSAIDDL